MLERLAARTRRNRSGIGVVLLVLIALAALTATTGGVASADRWQAEKSVASPGHGMEKTIVAFDPAAGQLPEGVAVDKKGNIFVSLSPLGQLVVIPAGTHVAEPFGSVGPLLAGDIGLIGLATDAPGNVYGGVVSSNPDVHGVWRFDRRSGDATRIPGSEAILLPNALAFDKQGRLYVTDTIAGAVWRVPVGGAAEPWIIDPLLAGDGSVGFPFPIGANGIAIRHNQVYVGVTETANIVTIPIRPDGSAGVAQLFANAGVLIDGIALDVFGNVYIAAPIVNQIVRVNTDGSVEVVSQSALLDNPASLVFGSGRGDRRNLYVVNYSIALGTPLGAGPSVVRIPVGVPGWPQP